MYDKTHTHREEEEEENSANVCGFFKMLAHILNQKMMMTIRNTECIKKEIGG